MLQNLEAEQTLIGLALTEMECAEKVALLPEDTFFYAETKEIYKIIKQMVKDREIPNLVSIYTRFPEAGYLKPMEFMQTCIGLAISTAMYPQIEQTCLDLRKRRKLKDACIDVAKVIEDPREDVDNLSGKLTEAINDNGNKPSSENLPDILIDFFDELGKPDTMISTGVAGLDRITGGFMNGMLIILGARPKVGKTALALSVATHIAQRTGPVLMVSLEMGSKEIITRMMASKSGVNMKKIVTKDLQESDWIKLSEQLSDLAQVPIRFAKTPTPLQIRREAGNMKRNGGLSMIVVDYIQLMKPDEKTNSRYEAVSSITRELKLMAMDLDVPILALTQFNRESEQGGVRRKPSMSEARDSGSIEQDANLFLIQYPPTEPRMGSELYEYWASCQEDGIEFQILEIAANRQGPTGFVPMRFDKAHMNFTTLTMRRDDS